MIVHDQRRAIRHSLKTTLSIGVVGLLLVTSENLGAAPEDWSLTMYQGSVSGDSLGEVVSFTGHFDDSSNFTAVALTKNLTPNNRRLQWEWEGQMVLHYGVQDHVEFNALFTARWLPFPWDDYLDTNFAIGDGISWATSTPLIERDHHDDTSRLLNYLMFELEFPLHKYPNWSMFARLHHRSGVFGLFDDVTGASNAIGLGFRRSFN